MKQNPGFILQEIAGVPYLLPYGQMIADHKRGLKTNATGVYLWNLLETEHTLEEILSASADYYEISGEQLSEFREDISHFLQQLMDYDILCTSTDASLDSGDVLAQIEASRAAASQKALPTGQSAPSQQLLSIGRLNLALTGPGEAFPPDFADFAVKDSTEEIKTIHQQIVLHPELPQQTVSGKVLLHNYELTILEQEATYLLYFPTAKKHLEILLTKDGSNAHCYCPPPYNGDFHYDLFHAIRLIYLYLAQMHGMVALHSASILYRDKLWLFSGHSGMGKSTHTNLWHEIYNVPLINGDLNLLAIENGRPVVHGIPWCGTSEIYDTKTYPLGGIILLNKAKENILEELTPDQKQLLVSQRLISPTWTKELWKKNLETTEQVTKDILICRLHCTKEKSAAEMMKDRIDRFLEH